MTLRDLVKDIWDGLKGSGKGCVVVVVIIGNHWTYIRLTPDPHVYMTNTSQEKQTQTVQSVASTTGEANMVFD